LAIIMPVLGHATWRFYRRAFERDLAHEIPIQDLGDAGLARVRGLGPLWIYLDLLEYLRQGKVRGEPKN
jgi:hypothetical protein